MPSLHQLGARALAAAARFRALVLTAALLIAVPAIAPIEVTVMTRNLYFGAA